MTRDQKARVSGRILGVSGLPIPGESGPKPGMSKPPQTRSIRTNGRTIRTPTGQTGGSHRLDRSAKNNSGLSRKTLIYLSILI